MYYLYFVITARYLDYRDEAEYFQYLKRAAANPIILSVAGDLRKLYAIGDLGDYYKRNNRLKDAQVLFKHIVDSNAVPADLFRFYLAESYTLAKEYESAKEILHSLYCKRVFEADTELMSIFEEYNKVCLREAVYDVLNRSGKPYLRKSIEHQKKGEALRAAGDRAGSYRCNHLFPIYALSRLTVCHIFVYRYCRAVHSGGGEQSPCRRNVP